MPGERRIVRRVLAWAMMIPVLAAIGGQSSYEPGKTFPLEALKADLKVLWDILEEGHGGFDRYTPIEAQRKAFEAVEEGLAGPLTEFEFYVRLLPLIAGIKDRGRHSPIP